MWAAMKLVTFLALTMNSCIISGGRMKDKIYDIINGNLACFKRFNGTHEIGCTSEFRGNVGVVHFINKYADLDWFLHNGTHPPYMLIVNPLMFTYDFLRKVEESNKISGMVLMNGPGNAIPQSYSIDQQCPNSLVSLYKNTRYKDYCEKNPWNPDGSSLLFSSWNFPIFYVNDEDSINKTINCYEKFNKPLDNGEERTWPLCSMQLSSNMYGKTNTKVCLRRKSSFDLDPSFCEPLEDLNIWNSMKPLDAKNINKENSVTLVVTSADASSMFDHISPGAEAAVTKLVALLVTAEALFKYQDKFDQINKNIMFVIFEGETWDYIGSSRMAYDMSVGKFPFTAAKDQLDHVTNINLTHVERIIEINQVGLMKNNELFVYSDPLANLDPEIKYETNAFTHILKESNPNLVFNRIEDSIPLPPSSCQSFLKYRNISNIVIADFKGQYQNKYYQSLYDDYTSVNYKSDKYGTLNEDELANNIAEISGSIATSVFQSLTDNKVNIKADPVLANQLLYCLLKNVNCTYFQENSDDKLKKYLYASPARMYVSVKNGENEISHITKRLLARFTGKVTDLEKANCTSNYTQIYSLDYFPLVDNGTCYKSTVHHSPALSPAFIIPGYEWSSGQFSTWTESQWETSEAKIFLKASPAEEMALLIGGFVSLVLSFIITYFISHKAEILFTGFQNLPC